jgi:hypothetical protein
MSTFKKIFYAKLLQTTKVSKRKNKKEGIVFKMHAFNLDKRCLNPISRLDGAR